MTTTSVPADPIFVFLPRRVSAFATRRVFPPRARESWQRGPKVSNSFLDQSISKCYVPCMKLNPRQIEAFRLVFQTGNMTTAAQMMAITQPAVSRLIRDLEATLELEFFTRTGAGISATADAINFFGEVERSFVGLQQLEHAAQAIRQKREGLLHVAVTGAFGVLCLPQALASVRTKNPDLRIRLTVSRSSEILDLVATRRCHLGITALPPNVAGIDHEDLPRMPIVCLLPRGHPLTRNEVLRPQDLAGETIYGPPENTRLHQQIAQAFSLENVPYNIVGDCTLGASICQFVASGAGVAILDSLAARSVGLEHIALRPLIPRIDWEPKLLFPAGSPHSHSLSLLMREIRHRLDEIGASAIPG
ncbi:LysR family transcriptional regulator [Martelella sp. FLE1502]